MGFSWGKALGGAVTGFITGGPAGAALGAIGGGLSGGGDTATGTSSSQVREMTADEKARYASAQGVSLDMMQQMSPTALKARQSEIFGDLSGTLKANLNDQFQMASAAQDANLLKRGIVGSSSATASRGSLMSQTQKQLGLGTLQAKTQAGQMALGELASYRANLGMANNTIAGIESARRGSMTGTQSQTTPDTTMGDMLGMGMAAMTDSKSSWNTGGKDKAMGYLKDVAGWLT